MELVEKLPEIKEKLNPKSVGSIEKFAFSLKEGNIETYDEMVKNGVYAILPSHFKNFALDTRSVTQTLDLAKKMGFLENIKKNPNYLNIPVADIIKRMGKCDAANIPYRDEESGLCASFIFSAKEFKEQVEPLLKDAPKAVVEDNVVNINDYNNENNDEKLTKVREYAKRLLEVFNLNTEEDNKEFENALAKVNVNELSEKEILVAAFTDAFQVGNVELLTAEIDQVLEESEQAVSLSRQKDDTDKKKGVAA